MGNSIGIDFGTANLSVAVMAKEKPTIITNVDGKRITPSVAQIKKNGQIIVGDNAKHQQIDREDITISSIAKYLGSDYRVETDVKTYTAQEIVAMILQRLKTDAESYLCESVTDAVVAVPNYFNAVQRQKMKKAGELAGLNIKRIINANTATALTYSYKNKEDQIIMICDLGESSFTVSVVSIVDGVVEVLATTCDEKIGGEVFRQRISEYMIAKFRADTGVNVSTDCVAMQRIMKKAEEILHILSSETTTEIKIPFLVKRNGELLNLEIPFSIQKFNSLIKDLLERISKTIQNTLQETSISSVQLLRKIILVGGAIRNSEVQRNIKSVTKHILGKDIIQRMNSDESVAIGAAICAGKLSGIEALNSLLYLDVTSKSLAIETEGGISTIVIPKNTTLPIKKSQIFSTSEDYQSAVDINIVQGEEKYAEDNTSIGKMRLDGIPLAAKGIPQIEVTFYIDMDGIVGGHARDLGTGKTQKISILNQIQNEITLRVCDEKESKNDDFTVAGDENSIPTEYYGYNVQLLYDNIVSIINQEKNYKIVIVGTRHLNKKIRMINGLLQRKAEIIGLFDWNSNLIGKKTSYGEILNVTKLHKFLNDNIVEIILFPRKYIKYDQMNKMANGKVKVFFTFDE